MALSGIKGLKSSQRQMEVFMTLTTLKALKRLPWKIMTVMEATSVVLMVSDSCDNKLYCERLVVCLNNSKQQQRFF